MAIRYNMINPATQVESTSESPETRFLKKIITAREIQQTQVAPQAQAQPQPETPVNPVQAYAEAIRKEGESLGFNRELRLDEWRKAASYVQAPEGLSEQQRNAALKSVLPTQELARLAAQEGQIMRTAEVEAGLDTVKATAENIDRQRMLAAGITEAEIKLADEGDIAAKEKVALWKTAYGSNVVDPASGQTIAPMEGTEEAKAEWSKRYAIAKTGQLLQADADIATQGILRQNGVDDATLAIYAKGQRGDAMTPYEQKAYEDAKEIVEAGKREFGYAEVDAVTGKIKTAKPQAVTTDGPQFAEIMAKKAVGSAIDKQQADAAVRGAAGVISKDLIRDAVIKNVEAIGGNAGVVRYQYADKEYDANRRPPGIELEDGEAVGAFKTTRSALTQAATQAFSDVSRGVDYTTAVNEAAVRLAGSKTKLTQGDFDLVTSAIQARMDEDAESIARENAEKAKAARQTEITGVELLAGTATASKERGVKLGQAASELLMTEAVSRASARYDSRTTGLQSANVDIGLKSAATSLLPGADPAVVSSLADDYNENRDAVRATNPKFAELMDGLMEEIRKQLAVTREDILLSTAQARSLYPRLDANARFEHAMLGDKAILVPEGDTAATLQYLQTKAGLKGGDREGASAMLQDYLDVVGIDGSGQILGLNLDGTHLAAVNALYRGDIDEGFNRIGADEKGKDHIVKLIQVSIEVGDDGKMTGVKVPKGILIERDKGWREGWTAGDTHRKVTFERGIGEMIQRDAKLRSMWQSGDPNKMTAAAFAAFREAPKYYGEIALEKREAWKPMAIAQGAALKGLAKEAESTSDLSDMVNLRAFAEDHMAIIRDRKNALDKAINDAVEVSKYDPKSKLVERLLAERKTIDEDMRTLNKIYNDIKSNMPAPGLTAKEMAWLAGGGGIPTLVPTPGE